MATESSAGRAQRILFFLLTLASVLLLSGLTQSAPAMAQTCTQTFDELVLTDRQGYEPGETVHITGSGYAPNCNLTVQVTAPNGVVDSASAASDAAGNIAVDYVLVNGIKDYYRLQVFAQDGTFLAGTGFTDAVACQLTVDPSVPAGGGNFQTFNGAAGVIANLPNPGPCIVTVKVKAGGYNENVAMDQKNTTATLESQRIVIQADPTAAVGAVKILPAAGTFGFSINRSKFITIRGFDISGASSNGKGVTLPGSNGSSNDITVDSNIIHDMNGGAGVDINPSNSRVWVVNNLIRNMINGGDGIAVTGPGPHYIVNNTIYANDKNGVTIGLNGELHILNNLIVGNGVSTSATSGRFGVFCNGSGSCNSTGAANRILTNNMFYGNKDGDLNAVASFLDAADSGNYTPFSSWSVNGSSGSGTTTGWAACVFSDCLGGHAVTEIFDNPASSPLGFHLKTTSPISPAIDKGVNTYAGTYVPGTCPFPDDQLTTCGDFEGFARPLDGDGNATATVDIGFSEAPAVVINYTVSFNSNGGTSVASQAVAANATATEPTAPTKTGNTFAGWYSDAGLTTAFVFITPITGDITLYAKWTVNTYTVGFNSKGGSAVANQIVAYNSTAIEPTTTKAGNTFAGWYSDAGLTTSFVFTTPIIADITLYAKWTINSYTLTYTAGANGTITGTSPQTVNDGASGSAVTASPSTGFHFTSWSDGVLTASRTDANIHADLTVTANFAIDTYTLTYNAGAGGTITGTTPQTVNDGASGSAVTASPNAGYAFVSWSDGVLTASRTDSNVHADLTVTANFAIDTYTLTYNAGAGGSITGTTPQTVNDGASGSAVTASPSAGFHFTSWSDGVLTASRTDANIHADLTVTANFAIDTYTLTYNAGAGGTITGTTPQTVNDGASGSAVTASPSAGFHFTSWSDGVLTASRTDSNIHADLTVTANFAIDTYTLTYNAGAGGSITGTTPQTVNDGASGSAVTATPNAGFVFVSWSDGVLTASRTESNVHADVTVGATFAATSVDTQAPIVSNITPYAVPMNTSFFLMAKVDDSTTGNSNITSAAYTIDGSSPAAMTADTGFNSPTENVSASIAGYATVGVHNVCVSGTDAANLTGNDCALLAVYDPNAGFVTGGGWINSPAGAYVADGTLTGKANFGFVSKYENGKTIPTGNTEFQFKAGNFNFKSTSYDWLVVSGGKASYQGNGTINGAGNYKFVLTVIDGDVGGAKKADTFRLKVYADNQGNGVVYDNNITAGSDTQESTTAIGGGSIVIHTK